MEKKLIQYHIKKFLFTEPKWADVLVNMDFASLYGQIQIPFNILPTGGGYNAGELGIIMSPPARGGSINIPGRSHYRYGEIFRDNWLGEGRRSTVLTSVKPQSGSMGTGGGIEPVAEEFYSRRNMGSVDPTTGEIYTNTNPCCEITLPMETYYWL